MSSKYCVYYQADVTRHKCWFLVAVLRSFENIAFDRTLDKQSSVVEFFVAPDRELEFLALMQAFADQQVISNLRLLPNRLESPN